VLVALDGESAIRRAQQALPDVVLLDAVMPGIDGFEVARRLKADPDTTHIPIIFMTGLTETEHLVAALDAGGADYVTKPIKPREVMARMGVHLRTARHVRQGAVERSQARYALDAFGHPRCCNGCAAMWAMPSGRNASHPASRSKADPGASRFVCTSKWVIRMAPRWRRRPKATG
jgi:CheY-like chemotaxis protein